MIIFGYFLPLALLVALTAMLWNYEPNVNGTQCWVYGPGIILGGTSMLLFLLGLGMWRARQWAVSGSIAAALALSAFLPLMQQLMTVMQLPYCAVECQDSETERCTIKEFPYTAVTAISMSLNSLPVIAIVFLSLGPRRHPRRSAPPLPPPLFRPRIPGAARSSSLCRWRAAGDGPSFPMQQQLPNIANSLLVALGYRRSKYVRTQLVTLYAISLAILAIYSGIVYAAFTVFEIQPLGGVNARTGFFASLTVVMLDLEVRSWPRRGAALRPAPRAALRMGCPAGCRAPLFPRRCCSSRAPGWRTAHPSARCSSCSAAASRSS